MILKDYLHLRRGFGSKSTKFLRKKRRINICEEIIFINITIITINIYNPETSNQSRKYRAPDELKPNRPHKSQSKIEV